MSIKMTVNSSNTRAMRCGFVTGNKRDRGFTLLEALIGFMILSIGMLGIASLQAISLKAGQTSIYGSVAIMKVDELFESMRANPSALVTYKDEGAGNGVNNACTGTKKCSPLQLAQEDVFWWKTSLKDGMPSTVTTAVVLTPAVAPSKMATVTINVGWKERSKTTTGSVDKTYATTSNICTAVPC